VSLDPCRRPLEPSELPWLIALGLCLRELRTEAGLTQLSLGGRASISERSIRRLENGERRTRRSTLKRIADALACEATGPADEVFQILRTAAGPVLADESAYRRRIESRRRRRASRQPSVGLVEHVVERVPLLGGVVLERHQHRRWVSRRTVRERTYVVFRNTTYGDEQ
jgi:transcriptional regulator with XRE-family HTH domain